MIEIETALGVMADGRVRTSRGLRYCQGNADVPVGAAVVVVGGVIMGWRRRAGAVPPLDDKKGNFVFVHSSGNESLHDADLKFLQSYVLKSPGDEYSPFMSAHDGTNQFIIWTSYYCWDVLGGPAVVTKDGEVVAEFMFSSYNLYESDAYAESGHIYWVNYYTDYDDVHKFVRYKDGTIVKTVDLGPVYLQAYNQAKTDTIALVSEYESSVVVNKEFVNSFEAGSDFFETEGELINGVRQPRTPSSMESGNWTLVDYYIGAQVPIGGRAPSGFKFDVSVMLWDEKIVATIGASMKAYSAISLTTFPLITPDGIERGVGTYNPAFKMASPGRLEIDRTYMFGEFEIKLVREAISGPSEDSGDDNWNMYFKPGNTQSSAWGLTQEQYVWDGPKPEGPWYWAAIGYSGSYANNSYRYDVVFQLNIDNTNVIVPEIESETVIAENLKMSQTVLVTDGYVYEKLLLKDGSSILLEDPPSCYMPLCLGADKDRVFLCNQNGGTVYIVDRQNKSTREITLKEGNVSTRIFEWTEEIQGRGKGNID